VVLLIFLPLLLIGMSLPLVFGRIGPNPWYGVRTPKTLASQEIWYRANRIGGLYLIAGTLIALAVWGVLAFVPLDIAVRVVICVITLVASTMIATIAMMVRIRNL